MYDLRHHLITTLLEKDGVSERTVELIAGHLSERMKKRYSHARKDAVCEALGVVGYQRKQPKSQPTSHRAQSTAPSAGDAEMSRRLAEAMELIRSQQDLITKLIAKTA